MNIRHDHAVLLESLIHSKLPRNLSWEKVVGLIGKIGVVESRGNDEYAFEIGTQSALFKKPSSHDLEVEDVSRLRKFLREAQMPDQHAEAPPSGRTIVVIDHHSAHIYQDMSANLETGEKTVEPYDPFHFHHHLVHRKEAHYSGDRVPEENEYYEEIAKAISPAGEIVVVGHGTGTSNAGSALSKFLTKHHPEIAARIVAKEEADLSALTEPDIEELVRVHLSAAAQGVSA
jgi:hypothetical protein